MNYRSFGRTGMQVSLLGFGTWPFASQWWGPYDSKEARRAFRTAFELGVNFIDTAATYDNGMVESLISKILLKERLRDYVAVATKIAPLGGHIPPHFMHGEHAYPQAYLRWAIERSLRALGAESLFLVQLHTWAARWLNEGDWLETLLRIRADGLVRYIGVSVPDGDLEGALCAVRSGYFDSIQVRYNLYWQEVASRVFPECERAGVAVIVRSPLLEGVLSGGSRWHARLPTDDWRRRFFVGDYGADLERFQRALRPITGASQSNRVDIALRFAAAPPAVSTVLVGMRRACHVSQNARVVCRPAPGLDLIHQLEDLRARRV